MSALAYADTFDPTKSNFIFILIAVGGTTGIAMLTAIIVYLARRGATRWTRLLVTAALFWAMIAVGSLIAITLQQLEWQKQFQQDLMSGYGDPNAVGPGWHPALVGILAVSYLLLLAWSAALSR